MDHPSPQLITQLYLDNKNHSIYDLLAENSNKEKETSDSIKSIAHPIDQPRSNTLDQYTHLQLLSLANCSLTTLKYFPDLTNLKKLFLMDNRLQGTLEHLEPLVELQLLDLSNNRIQSITDLKPLTLLDNLRFLYLYECPVTRIQNYRSLIFNLLQYTRLEYLDGKDKNGQDEPEEIDNSSDADADTNTDTDSDSDNDDEEGEGNDTDDDDDDGIDNEDEDESRYGKDIEDDTRTFSDQLHQIGDKKDKIQMGDSETFCISDDNEGVNSNESSDNNRSEDVDDKDIGLTHSFHDRVQNEEYEEKDEPNMQVPGYLKRKHDESLDSSEKDNEEEEEFDTDLFL